MFQKIDVFTGDVDENGEIYHGIEMENGPNFTCFYVPVSFFRYNKCFRYASFSGFHMGTGVQMRVPVDLILKMADFFRGLIGSENAVCYRYEKTKSC